MRTVPGSQHGSGKRPIKNVNGKDTAMLSEHLKAYLEAQRQEERRLLKKYPWFNIFYNWLIVVICIVMMIGTAITVIQDNARARAEAIAEKAVAEYQARQQEEEQTRLAALAAEKQTAEELKKQDARNIAKLFYGIRNFEKKYNYTEADLYTLARCVLNRVESKSYPNTIEAVLAQDSQWIAYSVDNPVLGNYYQTAMKILDDYQMEEEKPCDSSFLWCETGEDGIWLIDGFGASYNRWNFGKGSVRVVKG